MSIPALERLATTFTVRDVMVTPPDLTCGRDREECAALLARLPDFDVIPLLSDGRITGYVGRDERRGTIDLHRDVISDSTSRLDLIDVLRDRTFCFVPSGLRVNGYVHFSDLNNRLVELSLYVLIQAVEHELIRRLAPLQDGDLDVALDPKRVKSLKGLLKTLTKHRADLDAFSIMQLKDYLCLARHRGMVRLTDDEIEEVYRVRNSVSHAQEPLITEHSVVQQVCWVKSFCAEMLATG